MTSPRSCTKEVAALHTPGPWHSQGVSERSWHEGVYDSSGNEIALVKVKSALTAPRRVADARLIAAAPEMFAMLSELAGMAVSDAALFSDDSLAKPFYIVHAEKIQRLLKKCRIPDSKGKENV